MKSIDVWTEAHLQKLIDDGVQESLTLDYKNSAALNLQDKARNELSKDVSAFANSAGGMIIYGIAENGHKPSHIDQGVADAKLTREWLEQTINSTIQPRIAGVRIKQIELSAGGRAFVIEIPQATSLAPHQANDLKYYKRYNFQSVAMADYEIRDSLRRSSTPDLYLEFVYTTKEWHNEKLLVTFSITIGNYTSEPALYSQVVLAVETACIYEFKGTSFIESVASISSGTKFLPATIWRRIIMVPTHMPIFKEQSWQLADISLALERGQKYLIGYSITAPGCDTSVWKSIEIEGNTVRWQDVEKPANT